MKKILLSYLLACLLSPLISGTPKYQSHKVLAKFKGIVDVSSHPTHSNIIALLTKDKTLIYDIKKNKKIASIICKSSKKMTACCWLSDKNSLVIGYDDGTFIRFVISKKNIYEACSFRSRWKSPIIKVARTKNPSNWYATATDITGFNTFDIALINNDNLRYGYGYAINAVNIDSTTYPNTNDKNKNPYYLTLNWQQNLMLFPNETQKETHSLIMGEATAGRQKIQLKGLYKGLAFYPPDPTLIILGKYPIINHGPLVEFYDTKKNKCIFSFEIHSKNSTIEHLQFLEKSLIIGSSCGNIELWSIELKKKCKAFHLITVTAHKAPIKKIECCYDTFLSLDHEGNFMHWQLCGTL